MYGFITIDNNSEPILGTVLADNPLERVALHTLPCISSLACSSYDPIEEDRINSILDELDLAASNLKIESLTGALHLIGVIKRHIDCPSVIGTEIISRSLESLARYLISQGAYIDRTYIKALLPNLAPH